MKWSDWGKHWLSGLLLAVAKYLNFDARITNQLAAEVALLAFKVAPHEENRPRAGEESGG